MWPLAIQIAEREDGFECPDEAFDAIFAPLDRGVAGSRHLYDAIAPLVGVLVSEPPADLGRGISLVRADVGDIAACGPRRAARAAGLRRRARPPLRARRHARARPRRAAAAPRRAHRGRRAGAPPRLRRRDRDRPRGLRAHRRRPAPARRAEPGVLAAPAGRLLPLRPHLLVVARATALRIAALDPRDPRREALGLFERALQLEPALQADALRDALGVALDSERSLSLTALRAGALAGRDAGERQRVRDLVAGDTVHDAALAAAARHVLLAIVLDEQEADAMAASADQVLLGARPRPNLVPQGIAELPR